ncbi:hypothetical protein AB0911_07890 [Streptomyces nigra]|uniref:hypothetical protein n=1 Tax=Streptomyces nigra TaxID=1827580 RepID=UPI003456FF7D
MSKYGPCALAAHRADPVPAVAWWLAPNGHYTSLCKRCLDIWFDAADDDETLEPHGWGRLAPPRPDPSDITAWASDPRNHQDLAAVLRREARIDPSWLRSFLAREWRHGALLAYS